MHLRASLLLLVIAALPNATQAASAPLSHAFPWCADDRATIDSCYYYSDGRRCWLTMSGLGVCVPIARVPSRHGVLRLRGPRLRVG